MELPKELTQLAPKKPPRLRAPTITATTTLATSAGAVQVEASANINDAVTANTTTRQQQSNQTGKAIERNQTELSTEGQQPRAKKKQLHFQSPLHDRTTPQSRDVPVAAGSEAQVAKQTSQVPFDAGRKHDIKTAVIAHDGRPIAAAEQTIWLTYARRRQRRSTDDANKLTSDEKSATAQLLATAGARADADADVDANCSNIKSRLVRGCTSLMHACQHGDMAQVLAQLRAKPERIRQRDSRNKNALHYCAAQQTRDLVAAASIAIAAPELLESADEDGFTPLHLAVIQGNLAMVNLLLANKADVNAVDNEGHSVVHWATVCGEVEALRSVLAAAGNVATPDRNGGTPLHYAAQMCGASYETNNKVGHSQAQKLALEILAILLAHPHSSVDVQDKDGRQPLLWAASAGSAKAVVALVKAGARVESADKDGLTALHCAASRGHTECIDTLISLCGAPTDLIDANGCTALHYAVTLGHADATSRLLDLDADPNRQDRKGRTPAHCGCSKGQFETVKLLKERGANLWLRNAKGDLPVHEAACSGRRELVEWLLEQRPKQINTTSNDGRSLLHIAAANDYTDMCKMLLDYGADANAVYRNAKGMVITPLDCALQKGHRSTAKFLQSQGGLPASKLRLAARRNNPFQDASSDTVRPLKYVEKEELHDLRNSKKYVVYLKHSDSEGNAAVGDGNCSCAERTYRREQRYAHTCRRHQRSRRQLRRRTSSCGEAKEIQRDSDDIDICRSKSNIEIRRRRSRERHGSSSEWDDKEEDEDSCENCCYHKRQKQRVVRRRSTSRRRSNERGERDHSSEKELSPEKRVVREIEVMREKQEQHQTISNGTGKDGGAEVESAEKSSRPQSAIKRQVPGKEATFIKSPTPSGYAAEESHAVALTDDEDQSGKAAELVTTQVDVHREADAASLKTSEETDQKAATESAGNSQTLLGEITDEVKREVEQVVKIAALAVESEIKNGASAGITETVVAENAEKSETKSGAAVEQIQPNAETASSNAPNNLQTQAPPTPAATPTPVPSSTPLPTPEMTLAKETESSRKSEQTIEKSAETATVTPTPTPVSTPSPATPAATPAEPTKAVSTTDSKTATSGGAETDDQPKQQAQQTPPTREQESRRSFTLLPSDSAEEEDGEELPRKSSFQILKSDDSVGEPDSGAQQQEIEFSDSQVFQIVSEPQTRTRAASKTHMKAELSSAEEDNAIVDTYDDDDYEVEEGGGGERSASKSSTRVNTSNRHGVGSVETAASVLGVYNEYNNSRKRRMKKRVRSGGTSKTRSNWKSSPDEAGGAASAGASVAQSSKDQDSGFEPSPRATKSKIPTPRNVYTAHMPRRHIYATLDGRSCSSRLEGRKPGERGACDMSAVTRSIQRNIRRYYMERKIFQHLLELKSLQIRSNKLNEAVLVKRAVDDYHKSCTALGGETGTRLRRYNFSEYTFKNFELFLYETLKALQKPGTYNFQNINDVYEEAERRLSPDYNAYEKALQCTTKTHRCLHAAHAYTGIPCAAYIPMMNHHTMPKFGFGPYKKTGVGSFYLPKILSSGSGCSGLGGTKVALELSHGKSKQLISLPSDKLDSNKRYYVTFTVKESGAATPANAGADNQATSGNGSCAGGSGGIDATGK